MQEVSRRAVLKGAAVTAVGVALVSDGTAQAQTPAVATPQYPLCLAPARRDFPNVGGNLGNQNYSGLTGISRRNIHEIKGAWMNSIEGGLKSGNNQSTAVAVDGVLYIESALGNVFAVDGATGATLWVYRQTRGSVTRRGVAVGQGQVFTNGQGGWVIALDQQTGQVVWEKQVTGYGNLGKVAIVYHDGLLYCGTADAPRNAALALDADNGDVVWAFWGCPGPGEVGNDTWEGDSWQTGGAAPWMHPAIDPELGLVYWTFGNARGNNSSQDGSMRGGLNLFSSALVAIGLKTGEYRWHFQSIHHGIWDMDNVMAPVLFGSKCGMYYILDRTDGSAPLGIDERPVPQEPRQKTWPTQPFPRQGPWTAIEPVEQPLGTVVPGNPNRAVPNYVTGPLYTPHWAIPILTIPGHGGGADWNAHSYSHSTGLMYTGYGYVAAAHSLTEASNGLRPPGEYQTGGIVAVDATTNRVRWRKLMPYELAHGNGALTTAGGLLFIGQPDGNLLCLDAHDGHELWRWQCGAAISSSPIMYEAGGEQYLAVYAGGTSIPYGDSAPRGDFLWAFKIGGHVGPADTPPPPIVRRPVSGDPVEGSAVNNTVVLARTYDPDTGQVGTTESTAVNGVAPTWLRVPVGTTVTFVNPADNAHAHSATQFFEGLFEFTLQPGQSAQYTFAKKGEYFFNDSYSPRPTGKVEVY